MKTARNPKAKKQPSLQVTAVAFTADDAAILGSLCQDASEHLGRKVSASAVLRAIVRLVGKGMLPLPAIVEFIERELESGRKWGKDSLRTRR